LSSIVVVGDVYALVARRDEIAVLMHETQDRARAQPGCAGFAFAEVVDDPGHYARPSEVRIHHVSETTSPVDSGPMDPRRAD
jgi:hypothetical protein